MGGIAGAAEEAAVEVVVDGMAADPVVVEDGSAAMTSGG
jgi:hypothetical protein